MLIKKLNEIVIENFDSLKSHIMNATELFDNEIFLINPIKKASNFLSRTKMFFNLCAWQGVHKEIPSLLHNDNASRSTHTQTHKNLSI